MAAASCRPCEDGDHLNCPQHACQCGRAGHPRKDTTTVTTYEYVTSLAGTVHLVALVPQPGNQGLLKTLCGRRGADWEVGDETLTGLAATCGKCRQLISPGAVQVVYR